MKKTILVLSCEHGGNDVPEAYSALFKPHKALLQSHRGIDFGALTIAQALSKSLDVELTSTTTTRLLIDCNRSLHHPQCFSEITKPLLKREKTAIIETYYQPYRQQVEKRIKALIDKKYQVLHVSVHSFTPVMDGVTRNAAIGLLYDPSRHAEKEVARIWDELLIHLPPDYRVRMNYPYPGRNDGFTTALRRQYDQTAYLGFELENNQAITQDAKALGRLIETLTTSLTRLVAML